MMEKECWSVGKERGKVLPELGGGGKGHQGEGGG